MTTENHDTDLATALDGLDPFAAATLELFTAPGAALAIVRGDDVALHAWGVRSREPELPVTPDTLFPIASCTKAFTAACLGILADEGRLDWDTPVREHLPELRLHDPLASERLTPRDLVCHRSGLPRHDLAWYNSPASRAELVERLRYLEPSVGFRELWQYQNLMYMTAGYLVERLSGRAWEEFVRERIFVPLGMAASTFSLEASRALPDHARGYRKERDGALAEMEPYIQWAIGPAGSINSTVRDLAAWLALHLGGGARGEVRLLSEGEVGRMQAPQMVMPPDERYPERILQGYGLGWFVEAYRGKVMVQHGGNIDGFSSLVTLFPREGFGVAVLTNRDGNPVPWVLTAHVADRLLGLDPAPWRERAKREEDEARAGQERGESRSADERAESTAPSHPLAAYAGEYAHPGYGAIRFEEAEGAALRVTYNEMTFPAEHYHYDTWEIVVERFDTRLPATFGADARGKIDRVLVPFEPSVPDIAFARVPPAELTEGSYLARFAGTYDLAGAPVSVALATAGGLTVSGVPGAPPLTVEPHAPGRFAARGLSRYAVEFASDAAGAVTEAVITTPGGVFTARRVLSDE